MMPAVMGFSDGSDDLLGRGAFEQVSACAGPKRPMNGIGIFVDGNGHDLGGGQLFAEAGGVPDAGSVEELNVDENDVGRSPAQRAGGVLPVAPASHAAASGIEADDGLEAAPDRWIAFDDGYIDGFGRCMTSLG